MEILVGVFVDLSAIDFAETKEGGIGAVDDIEETVDVVAVLDFFHALKLADVQVGTLAHDFRHTEVAFIIGFVAGTRYINFPL